MNQKDLKLLLSVTVILVAIFLSSMVILSHKEKEYIPIYNNTTIDEKINLSTSSIPAAMWCWYNPSTGEGELALSDVLMEEYIWNIMNFRVDSVYFSQIPVQIKNGKASCKIIVKGFYPNDPKTGIQISGTANYIVENNNTIVSDGEWKYTEKTYDRKG